MKIQDMETPSAWEARYWEDYIFPSGLIAWITRDGLLFKFTAEAIQEQLNVNCPFSEEAWWFNSTKDRRCAEFDTEGRIDVNPSILYKFNNLGLE